MSNDYHGSPADRGSADCWYARERDPHKYPNGTYNGEKVVDLTAKELKEYNDAYDNGEWNGKGF